ncbi:MAG: hypothetical protein DRP84_08070 [Spirochaetes bacterium]|nr:MAG: hypothetical protein DRP84_08070 [Spirochaetota bacterium]
MRVKRNIGIILFLLLIVISLFYILSSFNILPYLINNQEVLIIDTIIIGFMIFLIFLNFESVIKESSNHGYREITEKSVETDIIDTKFFENVYIEEPSNLYIGLQNYFRESNNFKELIDRLLISAAKITKSQRGSVLLYDEKKDELYIFRTLGWEKQRLSIVRDIRVKPGEGIAGRVFLDGEPIVMNNLSLMEDFEPREGYKSNSFISFPIYKLDRVIGVLNLTEKIDENYTKNETDIIRFICNEVAVFASFFLG